MMLAAALLMLAQDDLAAKLQALDPRVMPKESQPQRLLERELDRGIRAANERESRAWNAIALREDWEKYRDSKIRALRESLGAPAEPPSDLKVRVAKTIGGEGYRIENLVFESRPGLVVTANLYGPAKPRESMPGILVVHSHHNPKTQSELQDMGILWGRAGCLVLVMDQLGHGERRQHGFKDASSFPEPFRASRQDYWFRYNSSLQLYVAGESLAGWMAWDLMRGVDLLLARPGIDRERIILLGSVAGGGDPAGVAAALDPRISCVVPFNFGGPQPESKYPLPDDAETTFNYAGGGSWESTRNLRLSARDGFLPWVIVGSVAPRHLIHAHEFSWDRARDPVWRRYQKIWAIYAQTDRLAGAQGRGLLSGKPPEASHCNNIGADHRKGGIYAAFERWFRIPTPERENEKRHASEDLMCLTPEIRMRTLHELAAAYARKPADLRRDWAKILGGVEPREGKPGAVATERVGEVGVERLTLDGAVPLILLLPPGEGSRPAVVAVGQEGKAGFLKNRPAEIAALLAGGVAVCLADLRGTGETSPGGVGRSSGLSSLSAEALMLGETLPGMRVRDLRGVLAHLRSRAGIDRARIALWGDSFAPVNAAEVRVDVPWDAPKMPATGHPAGAMAALLGALFEPDLRAVFARGGLESFASALKSPYLHVPHDAMVPGALLAGDLPEVAAALAPRVRLEGQIDGVNRAAGPAETTPPSKWLLDALSK